MIPILSNSVNWHSQEMMSGYDVCLDLFVKHLVRRTGVSGSLGIKDLPSRGKFRTAIKALSTTKFDFPTKKSLTVSSYPKNLKNASPFARNSGLINTFKAFQLSTLQLKQSSP